MEDYSNYLKAELITFLGERDNQIKDLENKREDDRQYIQTLQEQINSGQTTAEGVISALTNLSDEQRTILPMLIRTRPEGIKAYNFFLYGNHTNNEVKTIDFPLSDDDDG